eukprot:scaffold36137_cov53-Phaeocystis_antarctica.AAC.1
MGANRGGKWTLLAKLHVQRDLEQAVLTVPLRQKNTRRKAFSRAENEVAGLGQLHQYPAIPQVPGTESRAPRRRGALH